MTTHTDVIIPQQLLRQHGVTDLARVCESTYDTDRLEASGIHVAVSDREWCQGRPYNANGIPPLQDLVFPDGQYPPEEVVRGWFDLLKQRFRDNNEACVAIHCVAGLGRYDYLRGWC